MNACRKEYANLIPGANARPRRQLTAGILALIFSFCLPAVTFAQIRAVRTSDGLVSGAGIGNGLEVFKGIPFAAPPVGKLRWRPPQAPTAWRGVLAANHFGRPCMQGVSKSRFGPWTAPFNNQLQPSEDCLYLNIWTTAKTPRKRLPVMVWIYGGGFVSGAGSVAIYNGAALARQGVVVVNFNYRVGPFGFLALPELTRESPRHSSGNYALLDQIAALRWVKRNISAFGGDPQNVTIFGQSAGASSVWLLTQSPLAEGLFQRAIIMSGPGTIPSPSISAQGTLSAAEQEGLKFADRLGVHSLAALRALPAEKILQAAGRGISWAPIRDGWVLRRGWHPAHEVPMINGMVADDIGIGYYGAGPAPAFTLKDYRQRLEALCGSQVSLCEKLYPAQNNQQAAFALRTALQDRARVSLYKWGARQTQFSPGVYTYFFNREIPWPQHPEYRVFHSSELPYVFKNLSMLHRPWQPVDRRVAKEMSAYWTNFAKTGSPNSRGLPDWPSVHAGNFETMQLGAQAKAVPLAPAARLKFWMETLKKPLGF
jgi:para-nitrobenzyl esterase